MAVFVTIASVHGTGPVDDIYRAAGYDATADTLTISGTASGNIDVTSVTVAVDGGTPLAATGTTSWSTVLDVSGWAAGTHTITATASAGKENSTPASATVWHSPDGLYGAAVVAGNHLVPLVAQA